MFERILIANRGEIAVRIIRACREMGVQCVAVYSEADKNSLHVKLADESICIGPSASSESYLRVPAIISAAEITDVEAIHPGYGFLSENAHFAEVCQSCNIKFIGPHADAIKNMGDKVVARSIVKKLGIPVVPGSEGSVSTKEDALKIAKKIGYPVIIKAAAGGGGRGMRIAHNDISLANAYTTARTEAEIAFKNSDVYVEKYIENPRHIEVQILADGHGNVIHLGERDCTIQRRHQKLLEESPSPLVDARIRENIGKMAVKIAKAVKYESAGTLEFLLDEQGNFYFIEMNTRVQVEHPVTEMVTGFDIVKEQLRIAAGEKISIRQKDIKMNGWAIECRINAEDPDRNFTPSPGTITMFHMPGGNGVRVDTHAYHGYTLSPYYDSMLAKLIVHGQDRQTAVQKALSALHEFIIEGVKSTVPLHKKILSDRLFTSGRYATNYIEGLIERT